MSAVGPNFPIKMSWGRLILLSLSKKHLVVSLLLYEKYVFNI